MPEPKPDPLMELRDVSKGFHDHSGRVDILEQARLKILPGEAIAVVGASGIGKSTLLHIMGTLDKPDAGQVFCQGQDLFAMTAQELDNFRNACIGFVFQFHYLLQGFTALENVMIPGLIRGETKKEIKKKALHMLERVGLEDRAAHRVEDLSGGEQQRTAIARALVLEPAVLLADEPTGNLDQANSDAVHGLLRELNQALGMSLVLVTHHTGLARMMDRQVTLEAGKIVPA